MSDPAGSLVPMDHQESGADDSAPETSFQNLDSSHNSTNEGEEHAEETEEAEEPELTTLETVKRPNVSNPTENPPSAPKATVLLDQERYLPIANVVRIMKTQMDPAAKLAKDAKECVQECVSEFISFIASEAASICHRQRRKTITADDLLTAMEATGFDNYAEPMRVFLMKYRQANKITGPIHREHANYTRPKQFRNDAPVKPLFFDTEQGRRCTETQYVINGSELVKNAPLADEWDEQTGTLIEHPEPGTQYMQSARAANPASSSEHYEQPTVTVIPRKRPPVPPLDTMPHSSVPVSEGLPQRMYVVDEQSKITLPNGPIELEQEQSMQLYIDPVSKQHFAAKETSNGLVILPIQIDDTPLHLENVSDMHTYTSQRPTVKHQAAASSSAGPAPSTSSSSPRKRVIHLPGKHESGNSKAGPSSSYHGSNASTSAPHRPIRRATAAGKRKRTS